MPTPAELFSVYFEYAITTSSTHYGYTAQDDTFDGCVKIVKALPQFSKITGYRVLTANGVEIINSPYIQIENI